MTMGVRILYYLGAWKSGFDRGVKRCQVLASGHMIAFLIDAFLLSAL